MVRDFLGGQKVGTSHEKSMKQLHTWILGGGEKVEHSQPKHDTARHYLITTIISRTLS